mmetsp:Transcript_25624/g.60967  ORF Transcript_25624/g.60967 Transcript_25624/m.60967 type:complete len:204 (+) Transcript_25624:1370-1981(+)
MQGATQPSALGPASSGCCPRRRRLSRGCSRRVRARASRTAAPPTPRTHLPSRSWRTRPVRAASRGRSRTSTSSLPSSRRTTSLTTRVPWSTSGAAPRSRALAARRRPRGPPRPRPSAQTAGQPPPSRGRLQASRPARRPQALSQLRHPTPLRRPVSAVRTICGRGVSSASGRRPRRSWTAACAGCAPRLCLPRPMSTRLSCRR